MKRRYAYNENDNYSLLEIDELYFIGRRLHEAHKCFVYFRLVEQAR